MFAASTLAIDVGYCREEYICPSISAMNDLLSVPKRFQEVLRLFESYIRLLDIAVGLSSSLVDNKALLNLYGWSSMVGASLRLVTLMELEIVRISRQ
jgi:hypothetical protein